MDLIKKIETVDFSHALRGYSVEEVDSFHADLVREIADLQRALDDASSSGGRRPSAGPKRSRPRGDADSDGARLYDPDGAVRRILAVAQRTADEAVSEAQIEADRVLEDAKGRADTINAESDQQHKLIVTEAAAEARRVAEATRAPLVAEIDDLEQQREALIGDLDVLDTHVSDQRERLGAAVARINDVLDDPESFRLHDAPELSVPVRSLDRDRAEVAGDSDDFDDLDDSGDWVESPDRPGDDPDDSGGTTWDADDFEEFDDADDDDSNPQVETAAEEIEESSDDEDLDDHEPADDDGDSADDDLVNWVGTQVDSNSVDELENDAWGIESPDAVEEDDDAAASVTDLDSARNDVFRSADSPLPQPEPVSSPYPDESPAPASLPWDDGDPATTSGPPTEAVLIDDLLAGDDPSNDRFLNELRRATEDEFGEDESDAAIAAFFDQDDVDKPGKRRKR